MKLTVTPKSDAIIISDIGLFNLEYTLECGQAFRWVWNETDNCYDGILRGKLIKLKQSADDEIVILPPFDMGIADDVIDYLSLSEDADAIENELKGKDDTMRQAVLMHPGMKIVKQEPWECLISYIISARNNIPSIKRIVERIADSFGDVIPGTSRKSFPKPDVLAGANIDDIVACKAAFRSRYIVKTAELIANESLDLGALPLLGLDEAREILMRLPGVGPKVAECIMLFSMGFGGAFPVDVWIAKAMREWYIKEERTTLCAIRDHAYERFGELSGYANQFLFFYARNIKLGRTRSG